MRIERWEETVRKATRQSAAEVAGISRPACVSGRTACVCGRVMGSFQRFGCLQP